MSSYEVHLIGGEEDETATLTTEPREGLCHIAFRYRDKVIESAATDYFEGFCQIRLYLELERLIPFCYGASLNVYPSGMARDMGGGLSAYRFTIGQRASSEDLVRIFDTGYDVIPASVALQREHFDDWIKSFKA